MLHLTEAQQHILQMVSSFSQQQIWPNAAKWDAEEYFPKEVFLQAAELGLAGLFVREDIGGSQLSRLEGALIFAELAAGCPSTSAFLSIHNMVATLVDKYATSEIRQYWGPQLTSMQAIGSYCLTEPNSGSDAAALKTTAVDCGDYFLVNGSKAFISGAGISDVYVTMVRTGGHDYKGISTLLIPQNLPGVRFGIKEHKMGWRNQPTAMVYFEDCKVPKSHLMGELGMGFRYALQALNGGRINIAACSLGGAQQAMKLTKQYMQERMQFGKSLANMQALRFEFANMLIDYEAAKLMLLRAASLIDDKDNTAPRFCAMAKKFVTEKTSDIVDRCLQLHGGYGYLRDYQIERIYRDLRVHQILEGTNEIMCEIIAKSVFDDELAW
jgi:alkylation response protein AidB-like acyl-CoA dehydrogenase